MKKGGDFHTVHTEDICALSVSECREIAEELCERYKKQQTLYIFIEEYVEVF